MPGSIPLRNIEPVPDSQGRVAVQIGDYGLAMDPDNFFEFALSVCQDYCRHQKGDQYETHAGLLPITGQSGKDFCRNNLTDCRFLLLSYPKYYIFYYYKADREEVMFGDDFIDLAIMDRMRVKNTAEDKYV